MLYITLLIIININIIILLSHPYNKIYINSIIKIYILLFISEPASAIIIKIKKLNIIKSELIIFFNISLSLMTKNNPFFLILRTFNLLKSILKASYTTFYKSRAT